MRKPIFDAIKAGMTRAMDQSDVRDVDALLDALGVARDEAPNAVKPRALPDPGAFYAAIRKPLFGGSITPSQLAGIEAKLAAFGAAGWPVAYAAYAMATSYWETAKTMQPVKEYGGTAYYHRMYDIEGQRPHIARQLGNTVPGDGARFAGRGDVQLTGRTNYDRAGREIGVDLIADPDAAMDPANSARIMVHGMAEGWFSGKKLGDYLPASGPATDAQFQSARRIINGVDKRAEIAKIAMTFQTAFIAGGWA